MCFPNGFFKEIKLALIGFFLLVNIFPVFSVFADTAGLVVPKQISPTSEIRKRIEDNFTIIEKKFSELDSTIKRVKKLSKEISAMIKNERSLVYCLVLESINNDIEEQTDSLKNIFIERSKLVKESHAESDKKLRSLDNKINFLTVRLASFEKSHKDAMVQGKKAGALCVS